jgi:PAS domain S-box-containing protein
MRIPRLFARRMPSLPARARMVLAVAVVLAVAAGMTCLFRFSTERSPLPRFLFGAEGPRAAVVLLLAAFIWRRLATRADELQAVVRDAAERKRVEERYRLLAEHASDVIWTADLQMNWGYISPSIERLSGFTPEESMRQTLHEMLMPGSADLALKTLSETLEQAARQPEVLTQPVMLEAEFRRKDGSTGWTEVNSCFVLAEDGRPVGLVGVTRDISSRRAACPARRPGSWARSCR